MEKIKNGKGKVEGSAVIIGDIFCKECKWPVIHSCCNDEMSGGRFYACDWWGYCSNKGCKNHDGEDWTANGDPSFTFRWNPDSEEIDERYT